MSPANRQILLKLLVAFLVSYLILLGIYWHESRGYAQRQAGKLMKDALLTHHAIHSFVEKFQRKEIYRLKQEGVLYKDFFLPELMSRTFAARTINDLLNEERKRAGEPQIYFKLATNTPRNPLNLADSWESTLLARMNTGNLSEYQEINRDNNGELRIFFALPIDPNNASCLICHGDPKNAPKEMLQRYGDTAGFWERNGEIRAMISMRVPLASYYKSANRIFVILSCVTLLVFTAIFYAITHFLRRIDRHEQMLIESEKMASLGRLVAGFAHEINTPIGIAVGASTHALESSSEVRLMLRQEEVHEDDLLSRLDEIEQACKLTYSNLNRTAEMVRGFKRTAVDQTRGEARLYNLREIIEDVVVSLHDRIKRSAVTVVVNAASDIQLYGRPGVVDQILTNLISNSLLHGFNNGDRTGQITITARLDGNDIVIDHDDDGVGINQRAIQKLFEPFFTTARENGGSGLGLFICYNLVTAELKGSIKCYSEPNHGTKFVVRYPAESIQHTRNGVPE
jgi:signal transduction histidine kinase